jgi:hypothetical protein
MAEGDVADPDVIADLQNADIDGPVESVGSVTYLAQRTAGANEDVIPAHCACLDEPPSRRAAGIQPRDDPYRRDAGAGSKGSQVRQRSSGISARTAVM